MIQAAKGLAQHMTQAEGSVPELLYMAPAPDAKTTISNFGRRPIALSGRAESLCSLSQRDEFFVGLKLLYYQLLMKIFVSDNSSRSRRAILDQPCGGQLASDILS
jgi:hypothetical protein